jgi:hypothetical protein
MAFGLHWTCRDADREQSGILARRDFRLSWRVFCLGILGDRGSPQTSSAAERVGARGATLDDIKPIAILGIAIMRALVTATIANAFVRVFPASSLRASLFRQFGLFCAAVLFVWLLSLTSGLDLSAGFF